MEKYLEGFLLFRYKMNVNSDDKKTTKSIILEFIEHNPKHHIRLKVFSKEICPCARCFGLWLGLFIGFFFSIPFWAGYIRVHNFFLIFAIAWVFVIPAIIDWITVKACLRKGKNSVRVATGFLYGIGVTIYLFILPAGIFFKIVTYGLYEGSFYLIRWFFHIKHYK